MKLADVPEIIQLSIPEKIIFLEDLWNSISSVNYEIPVPDSHKEELDERHERYLNSPRELLSLDELQSRIAKSVQALLDINLIALLLISSIDKSSSKP